MQKQQMKNNHKNYTLHYSAFDTGAYLLGFKDRSCYELKNKLLSKGYNEEDVDAAVDKLAYYGYIDDSRYARSYMKDNFSKKGRRLILSELKSKGIDRDAIDCAIDEVCPDEYTVIENIYERRFACADLSNDRQYRKVYSYFARRGFSSCNISNIMAKHRKYPLNN